MYYNPQVAFFAKRFSRNKGHVTKNNIHTPTPTPLFLMGPKTTYSNAKEAKPFE